MQLGSDILLIIATWAQNILSADDRVFDHLTKMASIFKHSGHHYQNGYTQLIHTLTKHTWGCVYVCYVYINVQVWNGFVGVNNKWVFGFSIESVHHR